MRKEVSRVKVTRCMTYNYLQNLDDGICSLLDRVGNSVYGGIMAMDNYTYRGWVEGDRQKKKMVLRSQAEKKKKIYYCYYYLILLLLLLLLPLLRTVIS
jgi:hypothetical protein